MLYPDAGDLEEVLGRLVLGVIDQTETLALSRLAGPHC